MQVQVQSKTAPRLLEEIFQYDPRQTAGGLFQLKFPPSSCRHAYIINDNRSTVPYSDPHPSPDTIWTVTAICLECRCHLDLRLDFSHGTPLDRTCPSPDFPLHHFAFGAEHSYSNPYRGRYHFECTAPHCNAILDLQIRDPILEPKEIALLTSHTALKTRVANAKRAQPGRGFDALQNTQPINALNNLRTYVEDSLKEGSEKRSRFSAGNKQFMATLGEDVAGLLTRLGFTFTPPEHEQDYGFWNLPRPDPDADEDAVQQARSLLADVSDELWSLLLQRPETEKMTLHKDLTRPPPSLPEFEKILGASDYDKWFAPSRLRDLDPEDAMRYAILGANADFSDQLLGFAYDRQVAWSPQFSPQYFEQLQDIANMRNSEFLATKVMMLASRGQLSNKDIQQAYLCLGIDPKVASNVSTEAILGQYRARLPDVSFNEQEDMKRALRILGEALPSEVLRDEAAETIETYQQALSWLGAQEDTDDEFITTMLATKIADRPEDISLGRTAVEVIAKARNSTGLMQYLATGEIQPQKMSLETASRTLAPDMNLAEIDDNTLVTVIQLRIDEAPFRKDEFLRAAQVIAQERDSTALFQYLRGEDSMNYTYQSTIDVNEPLGLQNIANSCYLNSLLQYLYTMKPLRETVLNYPLYEEPASTPEELAGKRINESQAKPEDVENARKFYAELRTLFENLITAREAFKATPELTRLALGWHPKQAQVAAEDAGNLSSVQASTSLSFEVDAGVVPNDSTFIGSSSQPDTEMIELPEDIQYIDGIEEKPQIKKESDDTSTLMDVDPLAEESSHTKHLELPDATDPSSHTSQPLQGIEPPETSPVCSNSAVDTPPTSLTDDEKPQGPPPLPPRPQKSSSVDEYDEVKRQQDAQEVLANVLPQLRYGLKATGAAEDGEQIDTITQLLFGKEKRSRTTDGVHATKNQYFNGFYCRTPPKPHTVYELLDEYFDRSNFVEEDGKNISEYTSICELPPVVQLITSQVAYNREKGSAYKMNSPLELQEKIYFDRYMDNNDTLQRRETAWKLKNTVATLRAHREQLVKPPDEDIGLDGPRSISATAEVLANLRENAEDLGLDQDLIPDSLLEYLSQTSELMQQKINELDTEISALEEQIQQTFAEIEQVAYVLQAVFIHRGDHRGGHYWIFIRDPKENKWRKYNDEYVTEVTDLSSILNPHPQSQGTASLVVYVRENNIDSLFDPICRNPRPAGPD